jgi:hypothetical protein
MDSQQRLHPPFARPDPVRRVTPQYITELPREDRLPDIEQFLDDLPLIDDFLLAPENRGEMGNTPAPLPQSAHWLRQGANPPAAPAQMETDGEGWAVADWQSYDWSGLASLGAPEPEAAEARAAWSSTSWDSATRKFRASVGRPEPLPGYEVAAALDEIARRIRTGELSLEEFRGTPPEAAIAALFAAFLRNKG